MKDNQQQVLSWTGLSEGGYVNHPDDPGGATNLGVTQRVYSAWRISHGLPARSVRHITQDEAHRLFVEQYFEPVWFDKLPSGVDYCQADYSINSGPHQATKDLQRVLVDLGNDIAVDGQMGVVTLAAVRSEDPALIVSAVCNRRLAFMKSLRHWPTFKGGWERRVMGETSGQQDWDSGVIDRGVRLARNLPQRTEPREAPGKAAPGAESVSWASIFKAILAILGGKK